MVGINPTVASNKLNIITTAKPVRQKVRCFFLDHHQIIQTEVDNLLRAGFIREVKYLEWLANIVRHGIPSFLDAFSGYHQIPMHSPDPEKTTFNTPHGLYFYNVMSFGLKNVGATYQRLVIEIFRPLLDNTMETYIDDMLVKSRE